MKSIMEDKKTTAISRLSWLVAGLKEVGGDTGQFSSAGKEYTFGLKEGKKPTQKAKLPVGKGFYMHISHEIGKNLVESSLSFYKTWRIRHLSLIHI